MSDTYGPNSLLQLFGNSITDNISLTEYKHMLGMQVPPRRQSVPCEDCGMAGAIGYVDYEGKPIKGYFGHKALCEWCEELRKVRTENEREYARNRRGKFNWDGTPVEEDCLYDEHCSCYPEGPCCDC